MDKYKDFVPNVSVRIQGETQHTPPATIKGPKGVWTELIEFASVRQDAKKIYFEVIYSDERTKF